MKKKVDSPMLKFAQCGCCGEWYNVLNLTLVDANRTSSLWCKKCICLANDNANER